MKKLICLFMTLTLLLCLQSTPITASQEQNIRLSSVKKINVSADSNQTQVFSFTNEKTVVWSNIPNDVVYTILVMHIYEHKWPTLPHQLASDYRLHLSRYHRDWNSNSFEIPLPDLDDGSYIFIFNGSSGGTAPQVSQLRATVVVQNGKYYFAEESLKPDGTLAGKLEDAAREYLKDKLYMGVSIGIVRNGEVLFLNYGHTEKDGDEITEHNIFEIGSITKTFTSTILADLANRRLLSLDDPLEKYVGFPVAFNGTKVRLIHLITHTSGLPRNGSTSKNLLGVLKESELAAKPGEIYSYSNLGYAILGYVIEKVTGKTYEEITREYILDKLDMENTAAYLTEEQNQLLAFPHSTAMKKGNVRIITDSGIASGDLKSSTYDMTKYIMANLGQQTHIGNRLKNAITLAQTRRSAVNNANGTAHNMGLAWNYGRTIFGGVSNNIIHHTGATPGYHSALILSHHLDAGIIVLCNNFYGDASIVHAYTLADRLLSVIRDFNP
jgi:CubicO group peptidase (beta-lactamase class C family)